jgi:hypothetical protein
VGKLDPERSERMATEFDQCSNAPVSALFFGVGLPPPSEYDAQDVSDHGLHFFNKKLLGAFPTALDKEGFQLLDTHVQVCGPGGGGSSMFVSAVQRYPMQPRLVPVTSLTDCRASGLNAINS